MLRVAVDEVALFFAATERGKSMTNLAAADVEIRDNGRAPDAIVAFRNEAQLPLRLGLIIDISNSVKDRFAFEQAAAAKFLNTVVTNKNDLAFLVGVNNSVLVVQDFTGDQKQMDRAVGELAPGGGTALWDAVSFAAEKLAKRPETQPVARIACRRRPARPPSTRARTRILQLPCACDHRTPGHSEPVTDSRTFLVIGKNA